MELAKFDHKFVFLSECLVDIRSRLTNLITALDNHSNPKLKELARLVEESLEKLARSLLKRGESDDQKIVQQVRQIIIEDKSDHPPQTGPSTELHKEKPHIDVATFESSHNQDAAGKLVKVEHLDDGAKVDLLAIPLDQNDLVDITPQVLSVPLGHLMGNLVSHGRHREAIKICEGIISKIRQITREEECLAASVVLNMLASVYSSLQNYEEAMATLIKVLQIRRAKLGDNHLSVAAVVNNLAVIYGKYENYKKAESLVQQSWKINAKQLHNHIFTNLAMLNYNFGALLQNQGKYFEAGVCYQQVVNFELYGPHEVYVKRSKYNLDTCRRQHEKMKTKLDFVV